jgi:hypothetical protein
MFKKDYEIEYVFNSFLKDESIGNARVGAISVFQIARLEHLSLEKRSTMYTSLVLSTVLHHLDIAYCENARCAMNNVDSVEEFVKDATLLVCPGCIRKLQFCRVLGHGPSDAPMFLQRLCRTISEFKPFAQVNQPDLNRLREYSVNSEKPDG